MNSFIEKLQNNLQPLLETLMQHPLNRAMKTEADVRIYMQHHVFAVWDFMTLAKALQNQFTCTTLPWMPTPYPHLRRFVNEIVLEEESDVDAEGNPISHFEMYLAAMKALQADTTAIDRFLAALAETQPLDALEQAVLPMPVKHFVAYNLSVALQGKPHEIAAVFTFGRETIIPDMFAGIVAQMPDTEAFAPLRYYLHRHIELDGDAHGPIALTMMEAVCGTDNQKWQEAELAAQKALQHRIALWSLVAQEIEEKVTAVVSGN